MANCKSAFLPALLSFLLVASVVHSRQFDSAFGGESAPADVTCATVYGSEQDDTCVSVGLKFKLDETAFLKINPNINCKKIFVGQWLCVNGNA
uniref:LysM domain-containing protein n=1 Tax=Kalanchoe fedtschenkoi TaxID=63787 RepID=A0A7N0V1D9_KALFE